MTDGVDNALPDVYGEGSRATFAELLDGLQRWIQASNTLRDGKNGRSVCVQLISRQDLAATTKRGYFAKAEP